MANAREETHSSPIGMDEKKPLQWDVFVNDLQHCGTSLHRLHQTFTEAGILGRLFFIFWYLMRLLDIVALGVGVLVWHPCEWLLQGRNKNNITILSQRGAYRSTTYNGIGFFLISLVLTLLFPHNRAISLFAYPLLVGCLYGVANNVFTVRECPEYYTMGHVYDADSSFRLHSVRTRNTLVKALVTGCYGSVAVTKFAALVFFLLSLVFERAAVPSLGPTLSFLASALGLAHCFVLLTRRRMESLFEQYARIAGFTIYTDDLLNASFHDLHPMGCNPVLDDLAKQIEFYIYAESLPLRLIPGWASNVARHRAGYVFALLGFACLLIKFIWID